MEKNNELNKSIRSTMNDDLLSDGDKKVEVVKKYDDYVSVGNSGGYVYDVKRGRYVPAGSKSHDQMKREEIRAANSEFSDLFGEETVNYKPYKYGSHGANVNKRVDVSAKTGDIGLNTKGGDGERNVSKATDVLVLDAKLVMGADGYYRHEIKEKSVKELVDCYAKEIAMFNDKIGVCWSSKGATEFRKAVEQLIGELYFEGTKVEIVGNGVSETNVSANEVRNEVRAVETEDCLIDPVTGEILDKGNM